MAQALTNIDGIHEKSQALMVARGELGVELDLQLMWSIKSGSLGSVKVIIVELLAIRADRDRKQYSMGNLLERHGDSVMRLCLGAPLVFRDIVAVLEPRGQGRSGRVQHDPLARSDAEELELWRGQEHRAGGLAADARERGISMNPQVAAVTSRSCSSTC